jgi:hypothetical protein
MMMMMMMMMTTTTTILNYVVDNNEDGSPDYDVNTSASLLDIHSHSHTPSLAN